MSLPLLLILLNVDPCQIILLNSPNFKLKALSILPMEEVFEADLMAEMAEVLPVWIVRFVANLDIQL